MSLTKKALEDRKWHGLEGLRDLLSRGEEPTPSIFGQPDSLERFGELLEVADRFNQQTPAVVSGSEQYCRDFSDCAARLEYQLREAGSRLELLADSIRKRRDQIHFQLLEQKSSLAQADQEIARLLTSSHMGSQGYGNLKVAARLAVTTYGQLWFGSTNRGDPSYEIAQKLRSIVIATAPVGYSNKDMIWKRFKEAAKGSKI
jgi:hypothetical protein